MSHRRSSNTFAARSDIPRPLREQLRSDQRNKSEHWGATQPQCFRLFEFRLLNQWPPSGILEIVNVVTSASGSESVSVRTRAALVTKRLPLLRTMLAGKIRPLAA